MLLCISLHVKFKNGLSHDRTEESRRTELSPYFITHIKLCLLGLPADKYQLIAILPLRQGQYVLLKIVIIRS